MQINLYQLQLAAPIFFLISLFLGKYSIPLIILPILYAYRIKYFSKTTKKLILFSFLGFSLHLLHNKSYIEKEYDHKTTSFKGKIVDIIERENQTYIIVDHIENPLLPSKVRIKLKEKIDIKSDDVLITGRILQHCPEIIPKKNLIPWLKKPYINIGLAKKIVVLSESKPTIKNKLRAKLKALSQNSANLARAMFLGDTFAISPSLRKKFTNVGLSHLLGVSVVNIAILSSVFYFLIRLFLGRFFLSLTKIISLNIAAQIGSLIMTFFYCILVSFEIPIIRSILMSSLGIFALFFGKNRQIEILLLSACLILGVKPNLIYDLSFQFSFAAVLGLCMIGQINMRNKFLQAAERVFYGTFFASILTIPISIYHFQNVCMQPFLSNIIGIPYTTFILTPLTITWFLLAFIGYEKIISGVLDQAFQVFVKITDLPLFPINAHFEPMIQTIHILSISLLMLSAMLFCVFKERIRYFFIFFGAAFYVFSLTQKEKKPFLIIHQYAIALILKDKIIAYPKPNFISDSLSLAYNLPVISAKNTQHFYKEK